MLWVEKWAHGKPPFLSNLAITFAAGTEEIFQLLEDIKSGDINRQGFPLVPLEKWLSFYTKHRPVWIWLKGQLGVSSIGERP